jgi:hypothetical protein
LKGSGEAGAAVLASCFHSFSSLFPVFAPIYVRHPVNAKGKDGLTWRKIVAVVRDDVVIVVVVVVVLAVAADALLVVDAVVVDHPIVWSRFLGGNQNFQLLVILVQTPQTLLIQAARWPVSEGVSRLTGNFRFQARLQLFPKKTFSSGCRVSL